MHLECIGKNIREFNIPEEEGDELINVCIDGDKDITHEI